MTGMAVNYKEYLAIRIYGFILLMMIGGCAMSADIELKWEWSAGRLPEQNLLVHVNAIRKISDGLFGVSRSPSLSDSLPDPQILKGTVVNTSNELDGKSISIVIPKLEIESIKSDGYAVLGLVDKSTCICIISVSNKDTDIETVHCP